MPDSPTVLLLGLKSAPYPYLTPTQDPTHAFFDHLDTTDGKWKRRRCTSDGTCVVRSYEQSYANNTVFVAMPSRFAAGAPFDIIVYFHGFWTNIAAQHLLKETPGLIWYGLGEQVETSTRNTILIAPQLPKSAMDGHPGKLLGKDALQALLNDVRDEVSLRIGAPPAFADTFDAAPIIVVSYSGGYQAAACCVRTRSGLPDRVAAMLMIDSVYGEVDAFSSWINPRRNRAIFVSVVGGTTVSGNKNLLVAIGRNASSLPKVAPDRLGLGDVHVFAPPSLDHPRAPVAGPPSRPLAWFLRLLPVLRSADPDLIA